MELLRPNPAFVIKSSLASNTDKKFSQALYINVCSHPAVGLPQLQTTSGGQQWSVPYFVGKLRYDQESDGTVVNTVDVVFHPDSTSQAESRREYHRVVRYY